MLKDNLRNKNVLLLVPYFFGYETDIKNKLVEMGADVTMQNDDPSTMLSTMIETCWALKKSGTFLIQKFENYIYHRIKGKKYDIVIVINGWAITSRLTKQIRNSLLNPAGRMVLYYWDSIGVLRADEGRRQYFDSIFTFDNIDFDCNKDEMHFLPLFYCDEYFRNDKGTACDVDLRTIGSYKYNRYFEIKEIIKRNPNVIIDYLLYAKKIVRLHKLFRKKYKDIDVDSFVYTPFDRESLIKAYSSARAVLDIPFSGQNGLTMRTFECLAMHKKIVTTNSNIKLYNFYNPDYIFVLDKNDYKLPSKEWFEKEVDFPDDILKKYSIESWISALIFQ